MGLENTIKFEPSQSFEEGATFTRSGSGIIVSVSEEKAVDSYNSSFECSLTMTREQAIELRDWLNKHFPS